MKTIKAIGLAAWACQLVNGDPSDLSVDEFADMQDWLRYHGVYDSECVAAEDRGFGRCVPGLQGDLQEYTFLVDKVAWRARCALGNN